jgi:hypothetical protein
LRRPLWPSDRFAASGNAWTEMRYRQMPEMSNQPERQV